MKTRMAKQEPHTAIGKDPAHDLDNLGTSEWGIIFGPFLK